MDIETALNSEVFEKTKLAAAIERVKTPRLRIAELGWFEEDGIETTVAELQYKSGKIHLITEKQRGEDGDPIDDPDVERHLFKAIHLPVSAEIYADDLQNLLAFGEAGEAGELQGLQDKVDEKSAHARANLDATIEFLRMGAIMGKIYGARGNLILDLFQKFGIDEADAKDTLDMNKKVKTQLIDIKRNSEEHQTGAKARRYRGLMSKEVYDAFMEDPEFEKAFDRWNNGAAQREDMRSGIYWQGVYWEENNEKIWNPAKGEYELFVESGTAVVVPEDKPGLFITKFCPANYAWAVNRKGIRYYTSAEPKKHGKGIDMEFQSNPINVCTNPLAVRRVTLVPKA